MVALTSGHLVLTRPEGRPAIGTDMRANTAFKLARSEPFPGSMFRTTISKERQTEHLYTWRRLKTYPLVVAVTTPDRRHPGRLVGQRLPVDRRACRC
ncbi:hypothetical protein LP419_35620 [Massilia sp. H-1]|nr:hypothetical protein LP419_35620 [Massilia sp. H-1]